MYSNKTMHVKRQRNHLGVTPTAPSIMASSLSLLAWKQPDFRSDRQNIVLIVFTIKSLASTLIKSKNKFIRGLNFCQRQRLLALILALARKLALQRQQFLLALSVHYSILIQIHHIFMKIATSINSGGDLHVHRQVHHGCLAHLSTSFWTDRRYA